MWHCRAAASYPPATHTARDSPVVVSSVRQYKSTERLSRRMEHIRITQKGFPQIAARHIPPARRVYECRCIANRPPSLPCSTQYDCAHTTLRVCLRIVRDKSQYLTTRNQWPYSFGCWVTFKRRHYGDGRKVLLSDTARSPEVLEKLKMRRYSPLPATLIGRLAIATTHKGQGLGEMLLMSALKRALSLSKEIASMAVVVDAKDDQAIKFYSEYGFIQLPEHPNRLFLPMATIEQMFA